MMLAWLFFPGLCDLRVLVVASKEHKYRNCQDRVEHLLGAFYILHNILRCRCFTSFNWTEVHAISIGVTTVCGTGIWTAWDCARLKPCRVGVWNVSEAPPGEQLELDLVDLGVEEVGWREGQVPRAVQNVDRALTTLYDHKDKNEGQQKDNKEQQDLNSRWPEGWLWQLGKMGRFSQSEMEEWSNKGTAELLPDSLDSLDLLLDDQVQWFFTEAEMQRWKEQKEQKLVELLWTIRSYVKMQSVWSQLGDSHANQPGHAAYARQKAWMYERWAEDARNLVRLGRYQALLSLTANVIEFIKGERMKEEQYLSGHLST
ncbi:hypothetical protein DFH09DRAFT_1094813 [Mycena vulgaris]|nr:hypothetical protein DFH09DRAFT_1094813 [Mycena vulgaris]